MPGTVLTVASGKGGVGKTTTAVNLAVALWTDGNAVAVVDADLGMSNLGAVLGLEPGESLHDVLAGRATLDEALVEAKDGDLLVLPGERALSGFADADPAELRAVLEELAERCDYVVVDTGAGLSYEDVLPLGLADEVLLVTTPDPAAAGDTRKTLELSGLLDGSVRGVVVTRALEDTDAEAVAAEIGVPLLAVIPEDPAVTKSTTTGDPLASHAPDAPATAAYAELAKVVAGGADADEDAAAAGDAQVDEPESSTQPPDAGDDGATDDPEDETTEAEAVDEEAETAAVEPDTAGEEVSPDADAVGGEPSGTSTEGGDEEPDEGGPEASSEGQATEEPETQEGGEESGDGDDDTTGGDGAKRRGGLTGWLGRLFS